MLCFACVFFVVPFMFLAAFWVMNDDVDDDDDDSMSIIT